MNLIFIVLFSTSCLLPYASGFMIPQLRSFQRMGSKPVVGVRVMQMRRQQLQELPLSELPQSCPSCVGSKTIVCPVCLGTGLISKTGFSKKNNVNMQKIIDSKWTSVNARLGHRHFVARGKKRKKVADAEVELVNTCGRKKDRVHIWLPVSELQNKKKWRCGWLTLEQIEAGLENDSRECNSCKGRTIVACSKCQRKEVKEDVSSTIF